MMLRAPAIAGALLLCAGCSHDWDGLEPQPGGGSAASAGGAGGHGGAGGTAGAGGGMAGAGGAGGGSPQCLLPIQDDFEDGVIDPAWNLYASGAATAGEANGAFVVGLPDPTDATMYGGLYSVASYDLTDCAVFVKVSEVPDPATTAYAHFAVQDENGDKFEFLKLGPDLVFKTTIANQQADVDAVTYSPAGHAYWRLRGGRGHAFWDTSPDGITWESPTSAPVPLVMSSVTVSVGAGTYQPEPFPPGSARFEALNLVR